MKKLLAQLQEADGVIFNPPAESKDLAACLQELYRNNLPELPPEIGELLRTSNGINFDGSIIYGLHPAGFDDLLSENLSSFLNNKNMLLLGRNEFDTLAWNAAQCQYEIIDNSDGEVLRTYASAANALKHILKID